MAAGGRNGWNPRVIAANLLFALMALALIGSALAANHDWADRHFLPVFARTRAEQLRIIDALRLVLAVSGLAVLALVRARLIRAIRTRQGRAFLVSALSVLLAIAAAFGAAELVLRTRSWQAAQERWGVDEPHRVRDRELGWVFQANHIGTKPVSGRLVTYTIGRTGYRVRTVEDPFDFARPTLLLAGESILLGYGLNWHETIAARLQARTGLQVANLSVNAYANDQMYLRLRRELPRFRRPVAVVIPFVPMLLDRNLDRDRPHLDEDLRWHAAVAPPWRLVELARRVLRYRSTAAVDRGVRLTRNLLSAEIALVRARGARPIVLVPQFSPEEPTERAVRRRVLDEAGIPYVLVRLPPDWRLSEDRHPDPRGARAIADAIAGHLGNPTG